MQRLLTGVPFSSATAASSCLTKFHRFLRFFALRANPRSMTAGAPACSLPAADAGAGAASSSSGSAAAVAGDGGGAQNPWLLVGLGNPGRMYKGTRHNVGFEVIDAIAEAEGISVSSKQFKAIVGKGLIGDVPVMLAKPQTYMNASGESVGLLIAYFKIPLSQVLVIYDDLDLPFAKLRLLPKGGHGGHNGMRSIINHLKQSRDFPRLRIGKSVNHLFSRASKKFELLSLECCPGIGRPTGKMDAINFVLRSFTEEEQEELDLTINRSLQAVRIMLLEGFNKSATFVNTPQPPEMLNR
uniref:Peptidyl-tRNA hydrolase n=1 Tax=Leersia perrieri TaxID=77586 RepID=A0A0D9WJD4_9ORYZ